MTRRWTIPALACLTLALGFGAPIEQCHALTVIVQMDDLPDEIKKQIEEQTENLPDEVRENVRKQIAEQVREKLKEMQASAGGAEEVAESASGEEAASDSAAKGDEEEAEKKPEKGDAEAAKPAGDPQSDESKKLRAEIELEATRFKHRVAMYEKELENERLRVEKEKIDRKLEEEQESANLAAMQRELERVKLEVELQKKKAEAAQAKLAAELAEAKAEKARIDEAMQVEDAKEKLEGRILGDEAFPDEPFQDGVLRISLRRIELNGPIYDGAADYVCQRLDYFNNQSDKPIFIVIDECPGGSATEGFQMVQAIKKSNAPVHVVVKRMAASMAAIIATLADHSYCSPDAIILHHQASARLSGNGRSMEDQMRQFKEISNRLIGAVAQKLEMTEQEFVDAMYRNRVSGDWDLFGDEAVEKGWIANIATTIREEGVRRMPEGIRSAPTSVLFRSEGDASGSVSGYLERYEVRLAEEHDDKGRPFVRLPRLSPLDAWLIYNPDDYYR